MSDDIENIEMDENQVEDLANVALRALLKVNPITDHRTCITNLFALMLAARAVVSHIYGDDCVEAMLHDVVDDVSSDGNVHLIEMQ